MERNKLCIEQALFRKAGPHRPDHAILERVPASYPDNKRPPAPKPNLARVPGAHLPDIHEESRNAVPDQDPKGEAEAREPSIDNDDPEPEQAEPDSH